MKKKLRVLILTGSGHLGWSKHFINVLYGKEFINLHIIRLNQPNGQLSNLSAFYKMIDKLNIEKLLRKRTVDLMLNLLYEQHDLYFDDIINSFYVHVPYRGGDHPITYYKPHIGKLINIPLKCYDYHILKRKNIFVFCNSFATYSNWFRFNVPGEIIYYPFDYDKYFIDPHKINIAVSIGVFSRFKMHEVTMQIAKLVKNVKFFVIGALNDPKYFEYLRKIKPSNVTLIPNASEELKIKILSKAKFYVHSRPAEGLGVANLEGMAAGAVPIVIDSGAFKEIVNPSIGFRWKTPEEAAEKISFLLEHPSLWQRLSNNAVQKVKMFSPEMFEERIKRGFDKLFSIYFA